jgi:5-formyltetrahydrofolate cyclo-ligase
MGAGYYDHTFAFLQTKKRPSKPLLIGLAYEWQRTDSITLEPWDIKIDGVCTEIGMDFF